MAELSFPGNPYEDTTPDQSSTDAVAVARAIELLAFEVRTSNMIAMAVATKDPVDLSYIPKHQRETWMKNATDIEERLGL